MCGAHYVFTALFVVTSSQVAAHSGHPLQTFDHDVITAGNAVVKSLPNRFFRGNRASHNDSANEERSVYDALASMINEGVAKLPLVAEIIETKPLAAKVVEKKPRATKAAAKSRAAQASKKKAHAAKAAKKTPRAGKAAKKTPPQAEVVEEVLHAAEAMDEMKSAEKYDALKVAAEAADIALMKHWNPSRNTAAFGDPSRDISGNVILSLPVWKIDFQGMRPVLVLDKNKDDIDRVHRAFVSLCDKNLQITSAETSFLWAMFKWKVKKGPRKSHKQKLVRQTQRYVLRDLRKMKENDSAWIEWEELSDHLKFGVLNYLLNLHYQRWVRMYNIFRRFRPDKKGVPSNLGDNADPNKALTLHTHSKGPSLYPHEPFNVAWASKGSHFVLSKRSRRTFDGNTDTASLPSKQLKTRSSEPSMPPLMEPTTSGDDSVPTKDKKSSIDDPSRFIAPYKPGDHSVYTENSRLRFGGPSSAHIPYWHPNVHSSQSLTFPSTALRPKDVDTELSLGGIYDRSTHRAPSVP